MPMPHLQQRVRTSRTVATVALLSVLGLLASACNADDPDLPDQVPGSPTASPTGTAAPDTTEGALYFYPPVEGATVTLTTSGAVPGTSEVTVDTVTSGADGVTVAVTEVTDGGAAGPVTVERSFLSRSDGGVSVSADVFGAFSEEMEVTAIGDDVVIPPISELEAGESTTGQTFIDFDLGGVAARNDVTYEVTGAGFTSVTVPVGTADAYQVDLALDMDNDLTGAISGTVRYWFVPDFGVVRQELTFTGVNVTTELTASSEPLP